MAKPAIAEEPIKLDAGAYFVGVRLELPHVEMSGVSSDHTICLSMKRQTPAQGLTVLSENNPLSHCPSSMVRQNGDTLTFEIICPGGNAARALAKYVIRQTSFEARIEMKMGGKNMTMTEIQSGHRVGDCTTEPRS
jgi:hypothetical protein